MKMEQVTISIKIPKDLYDQVSEILAPQGLTVEDALVLFLEETARQGRIPFAYTEEDIEEARKLEKMVHDDLCDV